MGKMTFENSHPLSSTQSGIRSRHLLPADAGIDVEQLVCAFPNIDIPALEFAFRQVWRPFDVFRLQLEALETARPMQRAADHINLEWKYLDWRNVSGDARQNLIAFLNSDRRIGFNLDQPPLMRCALIQHGDTNFSLVLTYHRVLFDKNSLPILFGRLAEEYQAYLQGKAAAPFSFPPYADYLRWLGKQDWSRAGEYWGNLLSGAGNPSSLGVEQLRHSVLPPQSSRASLSLRLTGDASHSINRFVERHSLDTESLLRGAWAVLNSRYTGETDILFGVVCSNRNNGFDSSDMVGSFLSVLPFRVVVDGNVPALNLLEEIQTRARELRDSAFTHFPPGEIEKIMGREAHGELFHSVVTFEPRSLADELKLQHELFAEWEFQFFEFISAPLFITACGGEEMELRLDYSRDLFDDDTAARILGHFNTLLLGMVNEPTLPVADLPLLTESETRKILEQWNDTRMEYPRDKYIHQLFEEQAERAPDAVAVVFENQKLTCRELNQKANQLARYLQKNGVGANSLVGVCMERSLEMVIALYGILKAGGAYVPFDPTYPLERLAFMLEDAGVGILLTQEKLLPMLRQGSRLKAGTALLCLDCEWDEISVNSPDNLGTQISAADLAYVIYTSGSTGKPKGALNTHAGIFNRLFWMQQTYPLNPSDRVLQKTPFSFDVSVWEFFWTLMFGAQLVVSRPEGHKDPYYLIELIEREQVSVLHFVPSMLYAFLDALGESKCKSVKRVICSGEALPVDLMNRFFELMPHSELHNLYGPTEAAVDVSHWRCAPDVEMRSVPLGKPVANTQLYILDRSLQLLPVGVVGELHIGGVQVGCGYLNRPELTAEKFIPNPFGEGRLYKTGDLAQYLPDGNIEYMGRVDYQVKIRGLRIELGEIESVLDQYPGVLQSVVIARTESAGQKRLAAYLTLRDDASRNASGLIPALKDYLAQTLPDYMTPGVFTVLDSFPLTPSGKIDRAALPEPEVNSADYVPPQNEIEQTLAEIWADLLGLRQVGRDDNFFELGGDSILSLQFISRAQSRGLYLSLRQVFEAQTIQALSRLAAQSKPILAEQGKISGSAPLTPIQSWFLENHRVNPHHHNQSVLLDAPQTIRAGELAQALEYLFIHHDALRSRFELTEFGWNQRFAETQPMDGLVRVVDVSHLPPDERQRQLEAVNRELQSSLNIHHGPLLRVALFDFGRSRKILLVSHHLVMDFVSWQVIVSDLWAAYSQIKHRQPLNLPDKTSSFKAWSLWLSEYAYREELISELEYWLELEKQPAKPLPVDYPARRKNNKAADADRVEVTLSLAETQALLQDVPGAYHTQINDILLTALAQAFSAWTGDSTLLINLEGHGRESDDLDLSRTVGWFTSLFPVRLSLPDGDSAAAIKSIKEQLRRVPRKGMGYGVLRYLNRETSEKLAVLPQPEVCFNYGGQLKTVDVQVLSAEWTAPDEDLDYLFDVQGSISGEQLVVSWTYGGNLYQRGTVENLAQNFIRALRGLIAHCISPVSGGYTPSDFPLSNLSQDELDDLIGRGETIADIYPLSPMQAGMLFHSLYAPESGVYYIQNAFQVHGNLNLERFKNAWQEVVNRHTIMRTSFAWQGLREPMQVVHRQAALPWDEYDWRALPPHEQQQQVETFIQNERRKGFDLSRAPLAKCVLIRLAENRYQFIWECHHLLTDGWSVDIMFKEVFDLYRYPGASLPFAQPYRDYIAWLKRQDLERAKKFWGEKLADVSAPASLGVDAHYPDNGYKTHRVEFPSEVTAQLTQFTRQYHLTLNTLMQGAYALMLGKYSGGDEVLFGVTVNGRPGELTRVEERVGPFINTLPLRVCLPKDARLLSWLAEIQKDNIRQNEYDYTPLVEIQQQSRVPSGKALFESILVFENYSLNEGMFTVPKDLRLSDFRTVEQTNYPLLISVMPGELLALGFTYDSSRFDLASIARMAGHIKTLLESMLADAQHPITELNILTEKECRQILEEWNDTWVEYPSLCVQDLFEQQVERTPDAPAVIFENRQFTYGELNQRANQLARYLQKRGIQPDTLVGIYIERSLEMIVGLLGILKAGGAYVPIDPSYPLERQKYIIEDSGVEILLTQEKLRDTAEFFKSAELICLDGDWQKIAEESDVNPRRDTTLENLAYVIYTSGSTGKPKGVMILQRGLTNYLNWCLRAYPTSGQGSPVHSSLSFDLTVTSIYPALLSGKKILLLPEKLGVESLEWAMKEEKDFSLVKITPAHLQLLNERLNESQAAGRARAFIIGGENLSAEQVNFWLEHAPETLLVNEYGPTETVVGCCVYLIPAGKKQQGVIPIGRPIDNTQLYVLDENFQPVPIGIAGELYIGGAGVARGYLHQPDLTAQRFIPNPFAADSKSRLYKTGDRARWLPDGNLEFLGRLDFQVKIRGYRVELEEIESVLGTHPQVRQVVVIDRADASGVKYLAAYVVLENRDVLPDLRAYLQKQLPEYMVPSVFMALEELPLTANGKVDRRALPDPEDTTLAGGVEFDPPQTPTEQILAGVWVDLLGLRQVNRRDNFFDLGGHSLMAAQLMSRLRRIFGVDLSVRAVFESPALEQLSSVIDLARRDVNELPPPMSAVNRAEKLPLSFSQQRLWFHDQIEGPNSTYNLYVPLRLKGLLDVAALESALNEIVRRHEVLRTTFPALAGTPYQHIATELHVSVKLVDLSSLPAEQKDIEAKRLLLRDAGQFFDLSAGPLFRAVLYQLDASEHILLLNMHHIVSDGWSLGILWSELAHFYQAHVRGVSSSLPPLELQYADFSVWQRNWLQAGVLDSQLEYWKKQLAGAPTLLDLPADHPRPPVQSFRGGVLPIEVDAEVCSALKELSRKQGVSLFMVLSAAFATLLFRYSGQEDIVIGSIIANRHYPAVERMIGYFVNNLALRVNLSGQPTFVEVLNRVRQLTLDAYANQDAPFDQIVNELNIPRNLSHSPLFQVMLSLDNTGSNISAMAGLKAEAVNLETDTAKFDLSLELSESVDRIWGTLEYSSDLFEAETAARMIGHLQTLLAAVAADPKQRISELPLLTQIEREKMLGEWTDTARDYPRKCYHTLFEEQVERTPENIAVVFEGESLTYRELNERANQLAHHLRELGIAPETIVGVCMERSIETLLSLLAIFKSGGVYVPLDPALPADRLSFMISNSQAPVVLTKSAYVANLSSSVARLVQLDESAQILSQYPRANPQNLSTPENLSYVIYTSGSTGVPKGAMVEHRGMVNHIYAKIFDLDLTANDRIAETAPQSFDISIWQFLTALLLGGATYIFNDEISHDPSELLNRVEKESITILEIVPSLMRFVLEEARKRGAAKPKLTALRWLLLTGEALPPEPCRDWFVHYPTIPLMNAYGPTECSDDVTHYPIYQAPSADILVTPIGKAVTNMRLYILDANMQPTPIGIPGELYVGGIGVGRGYLNNPERTSVSFSADPFVSSPAARFYKTGDLVRWLPDGNIEFLGRIDHQVKIRGFRIELGEIESVLSRHPAVREAIVVARTETSGQQRLVAYLTTDESALDKKEQLIAELRAYLKQKLPDYMSPGAFVLLLQFPLTPNGKVDRKALPEPDSAALVSATEFAPPQTPNEKILAEIWVDLLGVEQVGIYDNFFELGGDSIVSLQLVNRAQTQGLRLTPRQVFEAQTIESLARVAELSAVNPAGQDLSLPLIPPSQLNLINAPKENIEDVYPLSPMQSMMLAQTLAAPAAGVYLNQTVFELSGELDVARFRRAWQQLIERHATLHTGFIWQGVDEPMQAVYRQAILDWREEDWLGASSKENAGHLENLLRDARQNGFDLTRAPLMRCVLIQLEEKRYWFIWNLHHLLVDGWSYPLLLREVWELYQNPSAQLPAPPAYRDYITWLHHQDLTEAERFWRERLAGFSAPTPLPHQKQGKPNLRGEYGEEAIFLSKDLSAALQAFAQQNRVTLNTLFQAAWALMLSNTSGARDILFGVTVSGRSASLAEIESRVGLYINTLPVRVNLPADISLAHWLKNLMQQQVELEQYGYTPPGLIAACSEMRHGLLFGSNLRFQNYPSKDGDIYSMEQLKMIDLFGVDWWHYPLNLVITPDLRVKLLIMYDGRLFTKTAVRKILQNMKTQLLRLTSGNADAKLAAFLTD